MLMFHKKKHNAQAVKISIDKRAIEGFQFKSSERLSLSKLTTTQMLM